MQHKAWTMMAAGVLAGFLGVGMACDDKNELPPEVDPCGERGEFHTFVSDGPPFSAAIPYVVGEKVLRDDRFMFCDIQ